MVLFSLLLFFLHAHPLTGAGSSIYLSPSHDSSGAIAISFFAHAHSVFSIPKNASQYRY